MVSLQQARLYTFIDTAYLHGRNVDDLARQLCDGGSDIIQLRAKGAAPDEILRLAEKILPVTRAAKVPLVINDSWDVAKKAGAEFCHLGQEDFFDAGHTHYSQLAKSDADPKLGLSTHDPEQAKRALAAEPAYIAIGPVFPTMTKPTAAPVTPEYVRWAAQHVKSPWFAIGGINLRTLDTVLAAGATRICVVSAILDAPDVAKACRAFKQRL